MDNTFIQEKLLPRLTFNPGFALTGFRMTWPRSLVSTMWLLTHDYYNDSNQYEPSFAGTSLLQQPVILLQASAGLLLSFNAPVTLIFTAIVNLLLYGWIVPTTGQFTCSFKGPSNILSSNRCYRVKVMARIEGPGLALQSLHWLTEIYLIINYTCYCCKVWHKWLKGTTTCFYFITYSSDYIAVNT